MRALERILDRLRGYAHTRRMVYAVHVRLRTLEQSNARLSALLEHVVVCGHCRAFTRMDSPDSERGPQPFQKDINGERMVVAICHWCEPAALRLGWKPVSRMKGVPA